MRFVKMHGCGNDFIIINNIEENIEDEKFSSIAKLLCRRRIAIGADGIIFLEKADGGGDFKMIFYNSDGSRGEMCGNGARCIARYAYEKGLAKKKMIIETDAGQVEAERLEEDLYKIRLNKPQGIKEYEDCTYLEIGKPGVPHIVTSCEGLQYEDIEGLKERAEELRYDKRFTKGTNVNFYDITGEDEIKAITYERGVEDFTMACGSGIGAVLIALQRKNLVKDSSLKAIVPGGKLEVSIEKGELFLIGIATIVAEGEILLTLS